MLLRGISPEQDTFMRIGLKMLSNFEKTINHYRRGGLSCRFDGNNR